jgi:hypothetical protein
MSATMSRPGSALTPVAVALLLLGACLAERSRERCTCGPLTAPPADPVETPAPPAPAPADLPDLSDPSWTRVPSRAGKYLVCWRALGGQVPRNEDFELEVWVLRDGAPVRGAQLVVNGGMPEHGHGMLRVPRAQERADGSYLVEGMLLHMRGRWVLLFDVLEGTLAEAAECELVVK